MKAMIPAATAAHKLGSLPLPVRESLLRTARSYHNLQKKSKISSDNQKAMLMNALGTGGAGVIAGYFWADPTKGVDWAPIKSVPALKMEYIGAAAGLLGSMYGLGGARGAQVLGALGNGFLAIAGLKLGLNLGAPKDMIVKLMPTPLPKPVASGDDGYSGEDGSMGADPDLDLG